MNVNLYVKHVYGIPKMFFAEDEGRIRAMQALMGTKTLSAAQKRYWETLGFTFTIVLDPSIKQS